MPRFRSSILLFIVLAALVLATSAYAFAATNTVSANHTNDSRPISGYAASNISYAFDNVNPSNLTTVAFDLNNPASSVKVGVTATGTLQDCTSAVPFTHWTCALTDVTVTSASSLRIVASR